MTDHASVWAEITKSVPQDDGSILVYGKVSDETLDLDQQIADNKWLDKELPDWFTTAGNIREMHTASAAGKATEYESKDNGHFITAKVVDPLAKAKVEAGVYTGFSIGIKGPRVISDKAARGGRIVGGKIIEVSLVDRPANPSALFTMAKAATVGMTVDAADYDEARQLVRVAEVIEKTPDLHNDPIVTEPAAPEPVAGDEVCECCAECPGDSCNGACCAACQYAKQPTASGSHVSEHEGATATNGPSSNLKTATADDPEEPDVAVTPETITDALKAGTITAEDLKSALATVEPETVVDAETSTPDAPEASTETPDADTTKVADASDSKAVMPDTVKSMIAEALTPHLTEIAELKARLETVEKMAAPGGPSRTRQKADESAAAAKDNLSRKAAHYRATAKSIDDPELSKAFIAKAEAVEADLKKIAG